MKFLLSLFTMLLSLSAMHSAKAEAVYPKAYQQTSQQLRPTHFKKLKKSPNQKQDKRTVAILFLISSAVLIATAVTFFYVFRFGNSIIAIILPAIFVFIAALLGVIAILFLIRRTAKN